MADLTENQLRKAEALGREMLQIEPGGRRAFR